MEEYNSSQIQILEGLKAVRKVPPGMYIGSTDERGGLHHLIYEVVDNSIDESMAGFCSNISIIFGSDGSVTVEDDGRGGIPVDIHPKYGRPGLEIVLTELHSGGAKFDKKVYRITGGLHGVGVHVVNALSSRLIAVVKKGDTLYYEVFNRGVPDGGLKSVGFAERNTVDLLRDVEIRLEPTHGFIVKFYPDPEIFEVTDFSYDTVLERMRDLAFLNPQVTIHVTDRRTGKDSVLHFEGGLVEFVRYLGEGFNVIHRDPIYHRSESDGTVVEFALQYNTGTAEILQSFVNNINTLEGGTHVAGFRAGLSRVIQDYARSRSLIKGVESLTGDDVREGLVAVLHVKVFEPQFEGQTKTKLGNSEVKGTVQSVTERFLKDYFEAFPNVAEEIVKRAVAAAQAREASRKARELVRRKSALSDATSRGGSLPTAPLTILHARNFT